MYGMHVRFAALPGRADDLVGILLEAAEGTKSEPGCLLYLVSRSLSEREVVFVTEAWTTREAHDSSLETDAAQALMQRAMPLLAGEIAASELRPLGGKGV
ncbi:MAG TPA: putative quinol monooxygenase [Gaiellaceae bacterium]|jgi:quinol monooxygenase YgiN